MHGFQSLFLDERNFDRQSGFYATAQQRMNEALQRSPLLSDDVLLSMIELCWFSGFERSIGASYASSASAGEIGVVICDWH